MKLFSIIFLFSMICGYSSLSIAQSKKENTGKVVPLVLPEPYATKSVSNFSSVIGWPKDKVPEVPQNFTVSVYADHFSNPRNVYVAANGDVFIVEANTEPNIVAKIAATATGKAKSERLDSSSNKIILLRDENNDGTPDKRFIYLSDLHFPYGVLILGNYFYVGNTDGLWRYPYNPVDTVMKSKGEKILDLPAGGYNNHWTRNIIASKDNTKIFVAVGSASNVAEHGIEEEVRRANILQINPDGTGERIYASGLRNPNGLAIQPSTGVLYTAVNERDNLGDDLVPDYFTSIKENGFYGWPYSYFGQHEDPRMKDKQKPDKVAKAIVPDVALGAHVAALGAVFYNGKMFPEKYIHGAFVTEHGSWNRSTLSGYKVVYIPFIHGNPGVPEDFVTGFIADTKKQEVYGRPVSVALLGDGSMLLTDDSGNTVWRITYAKR